jgi:TRAP-type C4-dicarboxylate transport system permease small subunit
MSQDIGACWAWVNGLRRFMSGIVVFLFCIMMGAVLLQVGSRYLFNYSTAWVTELSTFCQVWLVLLGSGVAMARNQHMAIDLIPAQFSLRYARIASVVIALVILIFLGAMAYGSIPLLRLGLLQVSPAMSVPLWMVYACMPLGALYIALELVVSVIHRWNAPFAVPEVTEVEAAS